MCGRRKSGGKPPQSIVENGRELAKDMVAKKVTAVKDNYVVIRMGVAI